MPRRNNSQQAVHPGITVFWLAICLVLFAFAIHDDRAYAVSGLQTILTADRGENPPVESRLSTHRRPPLSIDVQRHKSPPGMRIMFEPQQDIILTGTGIPTLPRQAIRQEAPLPSPSGKIAYSFHSSRAPPKA